MKNVRTAHALRKKKGGKFLGEGQYGCVYSPPVPCMDESSNRVIRTYSNPVGKVFSNARAAVGEIELSTFFTQMDPKGLYLVPLVGNCVVSKSDMIKHEADFHRCRFTKTPFPKLKYLKQMIPQRQSNKKFVQLVYKHNGVTLENSFVHPSYRNASLSVYVNYLINLANGIKMLQENAFAHMDIKPDNVVIVNKDTPNEKMLLIDLGLADKLSSIYDTRASQHKLLHNSTHYPPEFQIYQLFVSMNKENLLVAILKEFEKADNVKESIENIVTQKPMMLYRFMYEQDRFVRRNKSWNVAFKTHYSLSIQAFLEDILLDLFANRNRLQSQEKIDHHLYTLFSSKYAKLVDVFQLGLLINMILEKFARLSEYEPYKRLKQLSRNTYNFNPNNRYSIEMVLHELKQIKNTLI